MTDISSPTTMLLRMPSQGGGLMGRLVNSVTSGEGVVLRFSGKGKVVICSRNKDNFIAWMRSSTAGNG